MSQDSWFLGLSEERQLLEWTQLTALVHEQRLEIKQLEDENKGLLEKISGVVREVVQAVGGEVEKTQNAIQESRG